MRQQPPKDDFLVMLTKTRSLVIGYPRGADGTCRILRCRAPREFEQRPRPQELHGTVESVQEVVWPVAAGLSHYRLGDRLFATISGTVGAPITGKRAAIGGMECSIEITSPVVFVKTMPAERAWVVPLMIEAQRHGDRIAHLLSFEQPWERIPTPGKTAYERYRDYHARLRAFPELGDPRAHGTALEDLAAALAAAPGPGMEEVRYESSGDVIHVAIPLGRRRRRGGRAITFDLRRLEVEARQRQAVAASLDGAWAILNRALHALGSGATALQLRAGYVERAAA